MIRLKAGVRVSELQTQALLALLVAHDVARELGVEIVVTSGSDGDHMLGSLHYRGLALDIRLPPTAELANLLAARLRDRLGMAFDVLIEKDHIHVEYDPK